MYWRHSIFFSTFPIQFCTGNSCLLRRNTSSLLIQHTETLAVVILITDGLWRYRAFDIIHCTRLSVFFRRKCSLPCKPKTIILFKNKISAETSAQIYYQYNIKLTTISTAWQDTSHVLMWKHYYQIFTKYRTHVLRGIWFWWSLQ